MKNLSIIILLLLPVMVMGQNYSKYETTYRNYSDDTDKYLIEFIYNPNGVTYDPPGQNHYSAEITVYKIDKCDAVQIGYPFEGIYTPKGCFEDDPKYLISEAKKSVKPPKSEYEILDADSIKTEIVPGIGIKIDTATIGSFTVTVADSLSVWSGPVKPQYDTIPIVMLVSDTTKMEIGTRWDSGTWNKQSMYNYYDVSFMFGYELIQMPEYAYADPIAAYLDDKKKPLSKSIIVWQSKRR